MTVDQAQAAFRAAESGMMYTRQYGGDVVAARAKMDAAAAALAAAKKLAYAEAVVRKRERAKQHVAPPPAAVVKPPVTVTRLADPMAPVPVRVPAPTLMKPVNVGGTVVIPESELVRRPTVADPDLLRVPTPVDYSKHVRRPEAPAARPEPVGKRDYTWLLYLLMLLYPQLFRSTTQPHQVTSSSSSSWRGWKPL